jgi:hypothetical protein
VRSDIDSSIESRHHKEGGGVVVRYLGEEGPREKQSQKKEPHPSQEGGGDRDV